MLFVFLFADGFSVFRYLLVCQRLQLLGVHPSYPDAILHCLDIQRGIEVILINGNYCIIIPVEHDFKGLEYTILKYKHCLLYTSPSPRD